MLAGSLMLASLVLMAAAETYFVYKFVRLFLPSSREEYISTRTALAFFCKCCPFSSAYG